MSDRSPNDASAALGRQHALVTALFLLASLVKLAPVVGFFLPSQIPDAYGIAVQDPNLLILLRHRAALFAIVGVLLAVASFRPSLRMLAAAVGLYSMLSFNVAVWLGGPVNAQLDLYAFIDQAAVVVLVAALALDRLSRAKRTGP